MTGSAARRPDGDVQAHGTTTARGHHQPGRQRLRTVLPGACAARRDRRDRLGGHRLDPAVASADERHGDGRGAVGPTGVEGGVERAAEAERQVDDDLVVRLDRHPRRLVVPRRDHAHGAPAVAPAPQVDGDLAQRQVGGARELLGHTRDREGQGRADAEGVGPDESVGVPVGCETLGEEVAGVVCVARQDGPAQVVEHRA